MTDVYQELTEACVLAPRKAFWTHIAVTMGCLEETRELFLEGFVTHALVLVKV